MMYLINRGFIKGDNPNEWYRDNWIIRYFDSEVEIFENKFDKRSGKYYKGNIDEIDMELILDEIDEEYFR